jgi:hypothetical protein
MDFINELIVMIATTLLRGVMAIGAGLVYLQFLTLSFVLAMISTVAFAMVLAVAKIALLGH